LAKIRVTMRFSEETLERLGELPRKKIFGSGEKAGPGFSKFRRRWEKILVGSSEPLVQGYFRELSIPENKLPLK